MISAIAEPLRHEIELSDTELGFSMAFAFGIVRIFIGIPVGRLADTHNRRNILLDVISLARDSELPQRLDETIELLQKGLD